MSTSLLYHTCGIRGYEYRSTEFVCGTTFVHIGQPPVRGMGSDQGVEEERLGATLSETEAPSPEAPGGRRNLHRPRPALPNAGARSRHGRDRVCRAGKGGRCPETLLETAPGVAGEDPGRGGRLVSGIHQGGPGARRISTRLPRPLWIGMAIVVGGIVALGTTIGVRAYRQNRAIRAIEQLRCRVQTSPRPPKWLHDRVGSERMKPFDEVLAVNCQGAEATDGTLSHVGQLSAAFRAGVLVGRQGDVPRRNAEQTVPTTGGVFGSFVLRPALRYDGRLLRFVQSLPNSPIDAN